MYCRSVLYKSCVSYNIKKKQEIFQCAPNPFSTLKEGSTPHNSSNWLVPLEFMPE